MTIPEAAEYSSFGMNRIERLLRSPDCPFVFYVGKKKLVKRREFEQYIGSHIDISSTWLLFNTRPCATINTVAWGRLPGERHSRQIRKKPKRGKDI